MMYQKTLVTRFSGKEFLTPEGTNTDLTKKGLRPRGPCWVFLDPQYEHRPDEEGIETANVCECASPRRTNTDLTKKGLRRLGVFPSRSLEKYEHRPDEEGIETAGPVAHCHEIDVRTQT